MNYDFAEVCKVTHQLLRCFYSEVHKKIWVSDTADPGHCRVTCRPDLAVTPQASLAQ